ncbi:ATP-dependent nuclease [Hyalangium versicolor]|uniref:ATP-dependent nuclease n=1 Tax=Hyalangium versicolor TaxID=2861190 RepID=UPI001CCF4BFF|nr:AAA family ATPase [Hyalangium versicolor]
MHFESEQWKDLAPRAGYPCVVLERGRPWNDLGHTTSFTAYYVSNVGQELELGALKILQRGQQRTELPSTFTQLGDSFCSLGQSLEFYEHIQKLGPEIAQDILTGLRDVVFNPALRSEFQQDLGYTRSLLRGSSALWVLRTAGALFGHAPEAVPPPSFTYTRVLEGFDTPHRLEIEFQETEWLGRIVALVGRNGTGKTNLMGILAYALSGLNEKEVPNLGATRPLVSQVIAISYSAFDMFKRPSYREDGVNYTYCGLRDKDGRIDMDSAMKSFATALSSIRQQQREQQWAELLEESGILKEFSEPEPIVQLPFELPEGWLQRQSSGQKLFLLILAKLLASIRKGSILLFDEPESHLHPQMLSSMMRLLHSLLRKFRSYAIVATHSAIVLQEIPARDIRILERDGRVPIISRYPSESFGESLTEIVNTAFRMDEQHKNYFRILRVLLDKEGTRDRVTAVLGKKLSLNARMALHAMAAEQGAPGDEKP